MNVDRNPEAIAQTLVHEQQHINAGRRTTAGGERCATRRGILFVLNMSQRHFDAATSGMFPADAGPVPSGRGCGF